MNLLFVGLGGAFGAVLRYLLSLLPLKSDFPIMTFITNLFGAIFIGFIIGISIQKGLSEKWLLFWKTGVCGGFTTFSTFSLESLHLFQNGQTICGSIYVLASVLCCILGTALGEYAASKL